MIRHVLFAKHLDLENTVTKMITNICSLSNYITGKLGFSTTAIVKETKMETQKLDTGIVKSTPDLLTSEGLINDFNLFNMKRGVCPEILDVLKTTKMEASKLLFSVVKNGPQVEVESEEIARPYKAVNEVDNVNGRILTNSRQKSDYNKAKVTLSTQRIRAHNVEIGFSYCRAPVTSYGAPIELVSFRPNPLTKDGVFDTSKKVKVLGRQDKLLRRNYSSLAQRVQYRYGKPVTSSSHCNIDGPKQGDGVKHHSRPLPPFVSKLRAAAVEFVPGAPKINCPLVEEEFGFWADASDEDVPMINQPTPVVIDWKDFLLQHNLPEFVPKKKKVSRWMANFDKVVEELSTHKKGMHPHKKCLVEVYDKHPWQWRWDKCNQKTVNRSLFNSSLLKNLNIEIERRQTICTHAEKLVYSQVRDHIKFNAMHHLPDGPVFLGRKESLKDEFYVYREVQRDVIPLHACFEHRDSDPGCERCKGSRGSVYVFPSGKLPIVDFARVWCESRKKGLYLQEADAPIHTHAGITETIVAGASIAWDTLGMATDFIKDAMKTIMQRIIDLFRGQILDSLIPEAYARIKALVTETLKYYYANTTNMISALAPLVIDMFTDKREFSMIVLASYAMRISTAAPFLLKAYNLIKELTVPVATPINPFYETEGGTVNLDGPPINTHGLVVSAPFNTLLSYISNLFSFDRNTLLKLQLFNNLATSLKTVKMAFVWIVSLFPGALADHINDSPAARWEKFVEDPKGLYAEFTVASIAMVQLKLERSSVTPQAMEQWRQCYIELRKAIANPRFKPLPAHVQQVEKYYKDISNMEPTVANRHLEPIWIAFDGPSRIGKSSMAVTYVANIYGLDYDSAAKICYFRNSKTETWDGYIPTQHKVVIFDDYAAINSPKDPHADMLEMIYLVSTNNYICPMSTVDDSTVGKKGTFFAAELILTISNTWFHKPGEVMSIEALENRRHYVVHVSAIHSNVDFDAYSHLSFEIAMSLGLHIQKRMCRRTNCANLNEDFDCCSQCNKPRATTYTFNEFSYHTKHLLRRKKLKSEQIRKGHVESTSFKDFEGRLKKGSTNGNPAMHTHAGEGTHIDWASGYVDEISFQQWATEDRRMIEVARALGGTMEKHIPWYRNAYVYNHVSKRNHLLEAVRDIAIALAALIGGMFLGKGILVLMDKIKSHWKSKKDMETAVMETHSWEGNSKSARTRPQRMTTHAEGEHEIRDYRQKSQVRIRCTCTHNGRPETFTQGAVFITGLHMVATAHMFKRHNNCNFDMVVMTTRLDDAIDRKDNYVSYTATFGPRNIEYHPTKDLCCIDLNHCNIPLFPDITKKLMPAEFLIEDEFNGIHVVHNGSEVVYSDRRVRCVMDKLYTDYEHNERYKLTGYVMNGTSVAGMCGSALWHSNFLVGVHCGGFGEKMFSIAISSADFQFRNFRMNVPPLKKGEDGESIQTHSWDLKNDMVPTLGTLATPQFQNVRTDIRPSLMFDLVSQHTSEPAALSRSDPRITVGSSPLYIGVQKYDVSPPTFRVEDVEYMEEYLDNVFNIDTGVASGFLTEGQVINGDLSIPSHSALNLNTSAGYGYPPSAKGKRVLFVNTGTEAEPYFMVQDPDLRNNIDQLEEDCRTMIVPAVVIDSLKDERRSLEKVSAGKTRIFNIYPAHYTMLMSKYFGRFVAHFFELRKFGTFTAVGINAYSYEWHEMVSQMTKMSDLGFDGDGKTFDAHFITKQKLDAFSRSAIRWIVKDIPKEEKKQATEFLRNLFWSNVYAIHIMVNFCFQTSMGMLSGMLLTTICNTSCISADMFHAWRRSCPVEMRNLQSFKSNVVVKGFGDDHIVAVNRDCLEFYNFLVVQRHFKDCGMIYTAGAKNAEDRAFWPVKGMSFLKNNIALVGEVYVAQLDKTVIYEMMNWIRRCRDPNWSPFVATEVNCNAALRYAYFWGREFFNIIRSGVLELFPTMVLSKYTELEDIYCSYGAWEPTYFDPMRKNIFARPTGHGAFYSPLLKMQAMKFESDSVEESQMTTHSAILDLAKPFAGIIDSLIPHEIQKDALGFLGALDKPTDSELNDRCIVTFVPNLNAGRGIDRSIPLRFDPSSMTLTDQHHWKAQRSLTLRDIWSMPTALNPNTDNIPARTWSNTDGNGSTLFHDFVMPCSEIARDFNNVALTGVIPTSMSYVTLPFQHWRGPIGYEVEIHTSAGFHKGGLRLSFHPGVYDWTTVNTASLKSAQYFAMVNVADAPNKFRFEVPYISVYPWLLVPNSNQLSNDGLLPADNVVRRSATGIVLLSVTKQLVASSIAAPVVSFTVRKYGGEGYEVANTTSHNISITHGESQWETEEFHTQSSLVSEVMSTETIGATIAADATEMVTSNTTPNVPNTTNTRKMHMMGEDDWSLRQAMNKTTLFATSSWGPMNPQYEILLAVDIPNEAIVTKLQQIQREGFTYWEADRIRITANVAGSPFQSGKLYLAWMPLVSKGNFAGAPGFPNTTFLQSQAQIDFAQHILIDPFSDANNEMEIAFRHPQGFLRLNRGDTLGTLVLGVYSPLDSITGAGLVTVSLHMSVDDGKVYVPTLDATYSVMSSIGERFETHSMKETNIATNPTTHVVQPSVQLGKDSKAAGVRLQAPYSLQDVRHFEDVEIEVDTLCKKSCRSSYFEIALVPGAEIFQVEIADLFFPDGTGSAVANNGSGWIGWLSALFRAYRGDVRLKILLNIIAEESSQQSLQGVVFYDHNDFGPLGLGALSDYFKTQAILSDPVATTNYSSAKMGHTRDFLITQANPALIEIECPYLGINQFVIPTAYSGSITSDPYTMGKLTFVSRSADPVTAVLGVRIFASFSDASHFGIPTTLPRIKGVYGQYPDLYVAPGPLGKKEPAKRDSFVVIRKK